MFGIVNVFAYHDPEDKKIELVEITDVDYPYSTGSSLSTNANVTKDSMSILSKLEWSKLSNGAYKVTVTVRPNFNYCYTEDTKATINGEDASTFINDKNYLEVSYVFEKQSSTSSSPNSLTSLNHIINVNAPRHGTIEPSIIRVNHNKDFTVRIIPDDGYKIKQVLVDGKSVGAVDEYTFKKVTKTHSISASFEIDSNAEVKEASFVLYDSLITFIQGVLGNVH